MVTRFTGAFRAAAIVFLAAVAVSLLAFGLAACGGSSGGRSGSRGRRSAGGGKSATTVSTKTESGAQVFDTAGCSSCHTLAAAHSTGTIGPNLNSLKPSYHTVVHQVEHGGGGMPSFKDALSPAQIRAVARYVSASTR